MKIGFWGSGNMARVLGGAWSVPRHQVVFGSRSVEKSREVASVIGFTATGETNDKVAESSEVIVSTVRAVPSSFLTTTSALAGKVIIDLNNRDFPREYKPEEFLKSLAEATQKDLPSARVVKALNNQAMEVFNCDAAALRIAGVQAFIAGDDNEAKRITAELRVRYWAEASRFRSVVQCLVVRVASRYSQNLYVCNWKCSRHPRLY